MKPRPSKVIKLSDLPPQYLRERDIEDPRMEADKMLRECLTCHNHYNRLRPRCPACGTVTPAHEQEGFNTPREARQDRKQKARVERTKKVSQHACALCRKRAKKKTCPQCQKPIHPQCLAMHTRIEHLAS